MSVSILAMLAWRVDVPHALARLRSPAPVPLLLAVLAIGAQWPVTALRWRRLLAAESVTLSYPAALRIQLGSLLMNQLVPTLGGDGWRVLAVRRAGFEMTAGLRSVLLDRYFALLGLSLLLAALHPWFLARAPASPITSATSVGLGCLCVLLAIAAVVDRVVPRLTETGAWSQWFALGGTVRASCARVESLATLVGSSIVAHCLTVVATFCLARSLDVTLSLSDALMVVPPVVLLAALPISLAGWGVREGSAVLLFALVSVPASGAVSVAMALGLVQLLTSLPGVLVLASRRRRAAESLP